MMPPRGNNSKAWSAKDPARPEVAWSASLGMMIKWPRTNYWLYGPCGPMAAEQLTNRHNPVIHGPHLPVDAVLLLPDPASESGTRP
jgi:hypothetical protein